MNASVDKLLEQMPAIPLSEMQDIYLMDRVDSKFVAPITLLPEILQALIPYFKVQVTDGKRIASYATQYFDTPALNLFFMHQNGNPNRQKIRIRSYLDSNVSFLEIKNKTDRGRTRKIRVPIVFSHIQTIADLSANVSFLEKHSIFESRNLEPVLGNTFDRITLVDHRSTERVTLDLNLSFVNYKTGNTQKADDLLILELKQNESQPSMIREIMDRFQIQQVPFSKYCMGTVLTGAHKYPQTLKK